MKIDSTLIANTATELRGLPLKTGQTLAAIVLQANQSTGKAVLSLAGGQLTVSTRQPLTTGSAIELTVKNLGPPLVLGLTPSLGENAAGTAPVQTPIQRLVVQLMTRLSASVNTDTASSWLKTDTNSTQSAHTTTSPNSATMPSNNGTMAKPLVGTPAANQHMTLDLPLNVRRVLPSLDALLGFSRTNQISANTTQIPLGKVALEQTLARNLTQLITANSMPVFPTNTSLDQATSDIKSQLKLAAQQLKMQANLESTSKANVPSGQNTPSASSAQNISLQSSLEQWMNRLDVSQLRSAILQIQGQPTWVVDVPMMLAEQTRRFQIAIQEQSPNSNPPAESTWQVDFAIDLPELGPLHGSLSLQSTDLTVRIYADHAETRTQLDASLDQLADKLRAASLPPKELSIYPGPPPKAVQERLNPAPTLDEHTTFRYRV